MPSPVNVTKRLIRQVGDVHDTHQDAVDSLHAALAVPNVLIGFVDSLHRPVFFADCGNQDPCEHLGQLALDCVIGPFHIEQWPERVTMVEVATWGRHCGDTLPYMQLSSKYYLFGHQHPYKPNISVMYVTPDHEIGGIRQGPVDFDLVPEEGNNVGS